MCHQSGISFLVCAWWAILSGTLKDSMHRWPINSWYVLTTRNLIIMHRSLDLLRIKIGVLTRYLFHSRSELLRVWERNTPKATYARLLEACVETNNKRSAEKIVECLKTCQPKGNGMTIW